MYIVNLWKTSSRLESTKYFHSVYFEQLLLRLRIRSLKFFLYSTVRVPLRTYTDKNDNQQPLSSPSTRRWSITSQEKDDKVKPSHTFWSKIENKEAW
eukprot:g5218.t1